MLTLLSVVQGAGHPCGVGYSLDFVMTGWEDGSLRCFNSDSGDLLFNVADAHRGGVSSFCISKNERFTVSGGNQGEVRVWEMRSRELVSDLKEHIAPVTGIVRPC